MLVIAIDITVRPGNEHIYFPQCNKYVLWT